LRISTKGVLSSKQRCINSFAYLREVVPALFALGDNPAEASLSCCLQDARRSGASSSARTAEANSAADV
jgi:hypothetical protein